MTAYIQRRDEIRTYFDRTALDAWKRFASTEPLSRIRQTVREGRDDMRRTLLGRLPADLTGWRILDAGCGAGAASCELAARGADVVAVDLSPQIVEFAAAGAAERGVAGRIRFRAGDMLDPDLGRFDAVVAMDSLIHYAPADAIDAVARLAGRTSRVVLFSVAPKTPLLSAMHTAGRLFPRADRAPSIAPVAPMRLAREVAGRTRAHVAPIRRIKRGFYISQAMEAAGA